MVIGGDAVGTVPVGESCAMFCLEVVDSASQDMGGDVGGKVVMCREELSSSSKARARDQVEGAGEVGEGKGAISVATEFELATGWVDGGVGRV